MRHFDLAAQGNTESTLNLLLILVDYIDLPFKKELLLSRLFKMKSADLFLMSHNTGTRSHDSKFFKKQLKKGLHLRKHSFSQRVVDVWNKLPVTVVNVKTPKQFKKRINDYWKKQGFGVLTGL